MPELITIIQINCNSEYVAKEREREHERQERKKALEHERQEQEKKREYERKELELEIAKLSLEYPEVFPACVVTQSQAKVVSNPTANHDETRGPLADTVFNKWCSVSEVPVLNQDTLIAEEKQDAHLNHLIETACTYD